MRDKCKNKCLFHGMATQISQFPPFRFQRVSEQMGQMEFRDNRMEVERINNRKILGEVRYIVVCIFFFNIFYI